MWTSNCCPSSQARLRSECSSFTRSCLENWLNEEKNLHLHMSSPEIALCVFFKLLPVQPILVRPHPDSNLLNKMRIFSLSCLFVCSPGCHRSERAGKDGGNLSQQGSSLHEQSQSFVSHFTSFLFIQLCSNKAQE